MVVMGKTDLSNALRVLCLKIRCLCWVVLMAEDPRDGKFKYFADKCLLFGTSISCSHYQRFSNSLKFLITYRMGHNAITNYLDDFLFVAMIKAYCNYIISEFLKLCGEIGVPITLEKTEWASFQIIFLGILLDGERLILSIPLEKQEKALHLLNDLKDKKKTTVKNMQVLTRYLNFLTKAIFTGRMFSRRMYAKCSSYDKLKPYDHIKLDQEFKFDCEIWRTFLVNHRLTAVYHPMVDLDHSDLTAHQLQFYTDASANESCGIGAVFNTHWFYAQWEPGYIKNLSPSIKYLELYALVAAILTLGSKLKQIQMILFCDNESVVHMVNNRTSKC